jgi:hypothetical protein
MCRLGISRDSYYRYRRRFEEQGIEGLLLRSTRPVSSPNQTSRQMAALIVATHHGLREQGWDAGARSIGARLRRRTVTPPSDRTIHRGLVRAGLVVSQPRKRPRSSYRRSRRPARTSCGNSTAPGGRSPTAPGPASCGSKTTTPDRSWSPAPRSARTAWTPVERPAEPYLGLGEAPRDWRYRPASTGSATVGVAHSIVSSVYAAAIRDRRLVGNPCAGTRLPKEQTRLVDPMTTEQVHALIESIADPYRAMMTLAAGTGMRQGECFGLSVDRIDFMRRTLLVDRQLVKVTGRAPFFGPPKTAASVRTLPLPRVVVDALAAHIAEFGTGPDGLLFTLDGRRYVGRRSSSASGDLRSTAPDFSGRRGSMTCGTTSRAS